MELFLEMLRIGDVDIVYYIHENNCCCFICVTLLPVPYTLSHYYKTTVILHLSGSIPKDFSYLKPMWIVCGGPTKKLATALIMWRVVALSVSAGIVRRSFNRWRSSRQHVLNSNPYGTTRTCHHSDSLWTTTALVFNKAVLSTRYSFRYSAIIE